MPKGVRSLKILVNNCRLLARRRCAAINASSATIAWACAPPLSWQRTSPANFGTTIAVIPDTDTHNSSTFACPMCRQSLISRAKATEGGAQLGEFWNEKSILSRLVAIQFFPLPCAATSCAERHTFSKVPKNADRCFRGSAFTRNILKRKDGANLCIANYES